MADSGGSCKEEFGSTCKGLPADNEYEGKQYCVLHFPSVDKDLDEFKEAIEKKLKDKDFDFRGVYFPDKQSLASLLPNATFEGEASFSNATFKERAIFSDATFEGEASFFYATFEGEASFSNAIFKERAIFWSLRTFPQTFLSFRAAVIEKPERLSFHSTILRPSWFIDVDAQKFDFSDVEWFRLPDGDELELEKEIEAFDGGSGKVPTPSSLRKLQKACRKLMDNAEESRDYATANELHYWSMELLRKEGWRELGLIGTLYWALSGYGERPRRAFLVLAGMWALFAFFYAMVAGAIEHVGQAALYSLAAIVRLTDIPAMVEVTTLLQPSEPGLFQVLVAVEGILGPLQIALLVLAIRRRVMR